MQYTRWRIPLENTQSMLLMHFRGLNWSALSTGITGNACISWYYVRSGANLRLRLKFLDNVNERNVEGITDQPVIQPTTYEKLPDSVRRSDGRNTVLEFKEYLGRVVHAVFRAVVQTLERV